MNDNNYDNNLIMNDNISEKHFATICICEHNIYHEYYYLKYDMKVWGGNFLQILRNIGKAKTDCLQTKTIRICAAFDLHVCINLVSLNALQKHFSTFDPLQPHNHKSTTESLPPPTLCNHSETQELPNSSAIHQTAQSLIQTTYKAPIK